MSAQYKVLIAKNSEEFGQQSEGQEDIKDSQLTQSFLTNLFGKPKDPVVSDKEHEMSNAQVDAGAIVKKNDGFESKVHARKYSQQRSFEGAAHPGKTVLSESSVADSVTEEKGALRLRTQSESRVGVSNALLNEQEKSRVNDWQLWKVTVRYSCRLSVLRR